jgi:hypothetical protein
VTWRGDACLRKAENLERAAEALSFGLNLELPNLACAWPSILDPERPK